MKSSKLIIAFLNHSRPVKHILDNIKKICGDEKLMEEILAIYVLTDRDDMDVRLEENEITNRSKIKILVNKETKTSAEAKNILIDQTMKEYPSQEETQTLLYIFEDDVIIDDVHCIMLYNELITMLNLGVMFFGFGGEINTIFKKTNPRLKILGKSGKTAIFNQMPCTAMCVFNLSINQEKFNPELHIMEMKEYLGRLDKLKLIPFVGVFVDINDSFNYLHTDDSMPPVRVKDRELLVHETKLIKDSGVEYNIITTLDPVIDFLNSKSF